MRVLLYRCDRNLNRVYRTMATAGAGHLDLIDCPGEVRGRLYSAEGKVEVSRLSGPGDLSRTLILETDGRVPLPFIDWSGVERIAVGGENVSIPTGWAGYARCALPSKGSLCYTTEAAVSMALYALNAWSPNIGLRYCGHGLYASPLPRRKDIESYARLGIRAVVDLTQRPHPTVERACAHHGLEYHKSPHGYDDRVDASFALGIPRPFLVHCFHGRDRTGMFIRSWRLLARAREGVDRD